MSPRGYRSTDNYGNPGPLSKPVCATSGAYCPSKDRCSSTYEGRAVVCKFIRAASGADRAHLHTNTHYQHFLLMWIILPLLFHLFTPPPSVFLNTNPPLLTHHKLIYNNFPAMDTFKQKQTPLDNPLSIPLSIMYHHASMDSMSTSFHFTHARELEQMKLKQEKFYALRHARIQKQKEKLDNCSELPKCCSRFAIVYLLYHQFTVQTSLYFCLKTYPQVLRE